MAQDTKPQNTEKTWTIKNTTISAKHPKRDSLVNSVVKKQLIQDVNDPQGQVILSPITNYFQQ